LGGAALGNLFAPVSDADAADLLRRAWADGCRRFDTAPHYGHGLSERRFGDALRPQDRRQYVLSSKVGRLLSPWAEAPREQHGYVGGLPFAQRWDFSASGIRRSVEDSLQRLGLARLDVAYVHDMDAVTHGAEGPQVLRQVLDESLPTLNALRAEGLVGAVGLGVNDAQAVLDVLAHADLDEVLVAGRYTLLDQAAMPGMLPACAERGVRVVLGGLFNSGLLAHDAPAAASTFDYQPARVAMRERAARLAAVCARHGTPLRAVALQFAAAHPAVSVLLLGARQVDEWVDSLAMLRHPIPADLWTELRAEALLPAEAPVPREAKS
jgi:D-threo-aldose 1-dehydrogenase